MSGYLSFAYTGNPLIDAILSAVENAGTAYHHTSQWADDGYDGEPSCVEAIEKAAQEAAAAWADLLTATATPPPCGGEADLLEVARATGLRQFLHGVNAQDARAMLTRFVAALASTPAQADTGDMTAERAARFLMRFKRDEKMLGPNEQAALDFAISRCIEATPAQAVEPFAWVEPETFNCVSHETRKQFPEDARTFDIPVYRAAPAGQAVTEEMVDRALAAYHGNGGPFSLWTTDQSEAMRVALTAALTPPAGEGDGNG